MAESKIKAHNWIEFLNLNASIGSEMNLPTAFNELLFVFNNSYYSFCIYTTKNAIIATTKSNSVCDLMQGGGEANKINSVWFRIMPEQNKFVIQKVVKDNQEVTSGYFGKLYYR